MDTVANPSDHTTGSPLKQLLAEGQSPWLDFIRRSFVDDGSLKKLVDEDGLGGVTSNPSIFEKAMGSGADYDAQFKELAANGEMDANSLYETMAVQDIQHVAAVLHPVFEKTEGLDGYVSLEVSPYLALKMKDSVAEARRLWAWVKRPNLMVKVPGTPECVPAIRTLISEGININVTLLFSIDSYKKVAEAYIAGLEDRHAKGEDISHISSVASFFVSRIDASIDKKIDQRLAANDKDSEALKAIRGKVAIANAKLAYVWFEELMKSERWQKLKAAGANPQRLLWASTGTKDKAYSDVRYVEELIGRDTVNTIPPTTMDAFRDHGHVKPTLTHDVEGARHVMAEAERLGLDMPGVTKALVEDGVKLFAEAADHLLLAVANKRATIAGETIASVKTKVPETLEKPIKESLEAWRLDGTVRKLWARDASVWTGEDEGKWLAWLDIVDERLEHVSELTDFQADVKQASFTHVLLLGMGGIEPWPGDARADVRASRRVARIACAGQHRSAADQDFREQGRSGEDIGDRFEQVRRDARAEYPEGIFLGADAGGCGRRQGGAAFRSRDRPWLAHAEGGRGRQVQEDLLRQSRDRRALLGAVELRPGACCGDRHRCRTVPAFYGAHGAVVLAWHAAGCQSWRAARHVPGCCCQAWAGQGDDRGVARGGERWRLARATACGKHRQNRQGAGSCRCRAARGA